MCVNTVQKYVSMLVRKGLIRAENTSVITRDGQKRNGNLRYTILPIQAAIERYEHLRLEELELETARLRHQQRQNQLPA